MREISRLDYFAGLAMQSLCRNVNMHSNDDVFPVCDRAILYAETIIAKLDAKQKLTAPTFFPKIVETSTGYKWQVNEKTAKDLASGLAWKLEDEDGMFAYDKAMELFDAKLPTIEEWKSAEEHGCREILGLKDDWYWSASVIATNRAYAWIFYGAIGSVFNNSRSVTYSVRCIER